MAYADTVAGARAASHAVAIREHLLDVVTMISPNRTPLLSILEKFRAKDVTVNWLADRLASEGDPDVDGNSAVQAIKFDSDADFAEEDPPVKLYNRVQKFRETLSATDTMDYVETVDTDNYYATLLAKKIKLQAKRMEYAFFHAVGAAPVGSGNAASPGAIAAQMFGLQQIAKHSGFGGEGDWSGLHNDLQGTSIDVADSPRKHMLETHLGDILSLMYDKGAEPRDLWMRVVQKRQVADFQAASVRNIQAEDRMAIHTIDVYEGPTGVVIVNLHPNVESTAVVITQTELLQLAILKPTIPERLARIGDAFKGMLETALTLVILVPAAVGKIYNLAETYGKVTEAAPEQEP